LTRLAQRVFNEQDQLRFARVSGDYNLIHIDAIQARRIQAGAQVVDGIQLLLWALDALAKEMPELAPLCSMRVQFNKFVYLAEEAEVVLTRHSSSGAQLRISAHNLTRSKIVLSFGEAIDPGPQWSASAMEEVRVAREPLHPSLDEMAQISGRLPFLMPEAEAMDLFPAAARWIGTRAIAVLAASTQLVGMVCPGLHSIYNGLSLDRCIEVNLQDSLAFRVPKVDARFNTVEQEIAGGGWAGTASSFVRTPPVEQAAMSSLAGVVEATEFAGSVALVVGGSRGLGELTAKILAAGGARVIVTWQRGKEDAERVAREIREAGGRCDALAYDARKPAAEQLQPLEVASTHAYYFATPIIFRPQAEIFAASRLKEFLHIYVDGFWQLCSALRARHPSLSVFYPSSVAVSERPDGMTEYAMAKAAGEVLCAEMNVSLAPMHVIVNRLPRLATDQTASIVAVETASALETMLPLIREVQARRS